MQKDLKYKRIYNHYLTLIREGKLRAGDRLPTEAEIKKEFSVSQITVTNALNRLVADGYITRVQGSGSYITDAQSREPRLKLVLLIIPFMGKGRESRLIESIESRLSEAGYSLMIKNSRDDAATEKRIIEQFKGSVGGILLYPVIGLENLELYQALYQEGYPIVYLDRYPAAVPCSFVSSENAEGGAMIARHFLRTGHKRFLLLFHDVQWLTSERERLCGFMNVLTDAGISDDCVRCFFLERHDARNASPAYDALVRELLRLAEAGEKTGVFACNDTSAFCLMDKISEKRVASRYPLMTIAGFDNLNISPVTMPFITISQQHALMGSHAARILLQHMEKDCLYMEYRYIPVELVIPVAAKDASGD